MTTILLTGGHELLIDDADMAAVHGYTWHAVPARNTRYAQSSDTPPLLLHRVLMQPGEGLVVDHKNGNGLDNRRANLRVCTQSQNKANAGVFANNTSGYKGVSWDKRAGKWHAYITVDYRRLHLGLFIDAWAAAQAYNAAALHHWGSFALLNQPLTTDKSARTGGPGCPGTATNTQPL